jgi:hypothetical protein
MFSQNNVVQQNDAAVTLPNIRQRLRRGTDLHGLVIVLVGVVQLFYNSSRCQLKTDRMDGKGVISTTFCI